MAVMMRSMLEVADNSGARKLQMILPLGGSTGLSAGLGDVITASVKEAAPEGQTKKGTVVKAVIVRSIGAAMAPTSGSIRMRRC
jgi:large subunit ribosomal protein L14